MNASTKSFDKKKKKKKGVQDFYLFIYFYLLKKNNIFIASMSEIEKRERNRFVRKREKGEDVAQQLGLGK